MEQGGQERSHSTACLPPCRGPAPSSLIAHIPELKAHPKPRSQQVTQSPGPQSYFPAVRRGLETHTKVKIAMMATVMSSWMEMME